MPFSLKKCVIFHFFLVKTSYNKHIFIAIFVLKIRLSRRMHREKKSHNKKQQQKVKNIGKTQHFSCLFQKGASHFVPKTFRTQNQNLIIRTRVKIRVRVRVIVRVNRVKVRNR